MATAMLKARVVHANGSWRGIVMMGKVCVAMCRRTYTDRNVAHVDGVHLKAAMLRND